MHMTSVQSAGASPFVSRGYRWLGQSSLLVWIILFGLALRLLLLFLLRHNEVFLDELDYQSIAVSLLEKGCFCINGHPTAYRAPGEPLFIAGVFKLFGHHLIMVKFLQELLFSILPLYCARLARLLKLGPTEANLTALLVALHPALAYTATTVYPTALAAVFLAVGITYGVSASADRSFPDAIKSGIGLGAAGMFITTFAPLPVLVGIYFIWKRYLRLGLVLGLIGTAPLIAWVGRNRITMGAWVVATNDGFNLFLGANEKATPLSGNWVEPPTLQHGGTELADSRELTADAKWWIKEHPARWVELSLARGLLVLDSVGRPVSQGAHTGLGAKLVAWSLLPFVLLGVGGLWAYRSTMSAWLVGLALMLVILSSAITIVKPRFRFPCDPLLAPFAVGLIAKFKSSRAWPDKQ
jgi:hypothetical protein